jgi:hypothetical protein
VCVGATICEIAAISGEDLESYLAPISRSTGGLQKLSGVKSVFSGFALTKMVFLPP